MQITFTRTPRECRMALLRADGSRAHCMVPHKGPFPHDAMHYVVEREMNLSRGFWGLVAQGYHPDELAGLAKAGGHASAKRAGVPAEQIRQLLQAERLVECFEADLWGGPGDTDTLRAVFATACASSMVPTIPLVDTQIASIRSQVLTCLREWQTGRLELIWDEDHGH